MPDLSALSPWQIALIVAAVLIVLAHYKTSRADGIFVRNVHPYRRLMWFIMPTRNESVVYYEDKIRAEKLLDYLEEIIGTIGLRRQIEDLRQQESEHRCATAKVSVPSPF